MIFSSSLFLIILISICFLLLPIFFVFLSIFFLLIILFLLLFPSEFKDILSFLLLTIKKSSLLKILSFSLIICFFKSILLLSLAHVLTFSICLSSTSIIEFCSSIVLLFVFPKWSSGNFFLFFF